MVKPKEAPASEGATAPAAASSPTTATPPAPDPQDADPTDAEMQQYRPAARKFIGKLTRQRNEAREGLSSVQPELAAHRELVGYLTKHQLAAEDVNMLLGVGAALRRGDFKAFLDGIEPYREVARQSLGLSIAKDLRPQVEDGSLSEAAAAELTRTRLDAMRAKGELETQTQRTTERDTSANQVAMSGAVNTWEQGIRTRDPDYALKELSVRRTSQALMQELGAPKTPADALALVQRAYDEVTQTLGRVRPAPRATRQTPAGISTPSLGAAAEPQSLMEAARLGLSRTHRSL